MNFCVRLNLFFLWIYLSYVASIKKKNFDSVPIEVVMSQLLMITVVMND